MTDYIEMQRSTVHFPHASVLIPVSASDAAILSKIPLGVTATFQIIRERSLPQHRLFWAILKRVGEASKFETAERLLVALKIRLGRYDLMKMPNGKVVPVPHSISFAKMPQDEFQKLFDDSMHVIFEEIIPGTDRDNLIQEIQGLL